MYRRENFPNNYNIEKKNDFYLLYELRFKVRFSIWLLLPSFFGLVGDQNGGGDLFS